MQQPGHLLWCLMGKAHRKQKRDQHLPNENEAPRWCLFSTVIFENTRGPGPPQSASTLRRGDSASPSAATTYPHPLPGKNHLLESEERQDHPTIYEESELVFLSKNCCCLSLPQLPQGTQFPGQDNSSPFHWQYMFMSLMIKYGYDITFRFFSKISRGSGLNVVVFILSTFKNG